MNTYKQAIQLTYFVGFSKKLIYILFLLFFVTFCVFSQTQTESLSFDSDVRRSKARLDFYEGVGLLNSGSIAESIVAFQRAVSIDSENNLVQYWLSRANAAYGQLETAKTMWQDFITRGFLSTYFSSQVELQSLIQQNISKNRGFPDRDISSFIRATSIDVNLLNYRLPMSIRMLPNNTILLTSLGSNTLSILNPTGGVVGEIQREVSRLGRPTDSLVLTDGTLLVTEFLTNDIYKFAADGTPIGSFMKEGSPKLRGPQFLATDKHNDIYVSSFGNAEIFKFNLDGDFLLQFGGRTETFSGLNAPTGVSAVSDAIWVLDNYESTLRIIKFDFSGNYVSHYVINNIKGEGLRSYGDTLLITTEKRIIRFNTQTSSIIDSLNNADFAKLTSSEFDNNDMLWVVDQERERIEAFSIPTEQYAGLSTKIISVRTEEFPTVKMQVSVKNSSGIPVRGLERKDFVLFEDNETTNTKNVLEDTNVEQGGNVVIIPVPVITNATQKSSDEENRQTVIKDRIIESVNIMVTTLSNNSISARTQNNNTNTQKFWVMNTGETLGYTIQNVDVSPLLVQAVEQSISSNIDTTTLAENQEKTLGLAVNTLLPLAGKRSIIFLGGTPHKSALQSETWRQMLDIVQYHGIKLLWVSVKDKDTTLKENNETTKIFLSQLLTASKNIGDTTSFPVAIYDLPSVFYYPYLVQGVYPTLPELLQTPLHGVYAVEFVSKYPLSRLGEGGQYVGLSIESYYFIRSGKDFGGYVIPQF